MQMPEDYHSRSMSVSDIIEIYDLNDSRFYFCDNIGFKPIEFNPEDVQPPPEKYTIESLKRINPVYDAWHRVTNSDVEMVNTYIDEIRRSRRKSIKQIQPGDIVELTTQHGNFYRNAHIEAYDAETWRWTVCEQPYTPFIFLSEDKEIKCNTSGGVWSKIPNNLKFIGKRVKMFKDFGHKGRCPGGSVKFQAEVNVWEYKQDNPLYGDYSTKNWAKHIISYCVDELDNPKNGQNRYISSGFALEYKEDYEAWLKTYRGVKFKGFWHNQTVVFCYREKMHLVDENAWNEMDLPLDTRFLDGIKMCKVRYNDEAHIIDVYMVNESKSLDRRKYKPYRLARDTV
jgi:hypothetical protein